MRTVFVDSFYFFALLNWADRAHARVLEFSRTFTGRMVTTAWVLTELADGMSAPANRNTCARFLERWLANPNVSFRSPDVVLFDAGMALYASRPDKHWSLTDCIAFVVMQREGLTEALTGDHHFEQAGFRALFK